MMNALAKLIAAISVLIASLPFASTVLGATPPPLPTLPDEPALYRVFSEHVKRVGKMQDNRPVCDVRPYLDDMFYIASETDSMMDALDPLCAAYPQTDTQWRTKSFLPYMRLLDREIQDKLKVLELYETSNVPTDLPTEVRNEARSLRGDLLTMSIWIKQLIAVSTP
jgi:hypothetical protein